jgi:hypothetical protein
MLEVMLTILGVFSLTGNIYSCFVAHPKIAFIGLARRLARQFL